MGISLREIIHQLKQKTLVLLKLLLLEKRILFFGQKVERLSAYQYGLVSLVPELLRHLEDVGAPFLEFRSAPVPPEAELSETELQSIDKFKKMGFPLQIFGTVSVDSPWFFDWNYKEPLD